MQKESLRQLALVIGLGASGQACALHLARRGWQVRVADTREAPVGAKQLAERLPEAEIVTGGLPESLLEGVSLLVMSPGLSPFYGDAQPIVSRAKTLGIDVVGEIELFARALQTLSKEKAYHPIVIGITGTNGKTTTTTLVTRMANASGRYAVAAGNIGPNAVTELDKALDADRLPDVWVLELSSFQLATTSSLVCQSAAILNVTEDHLDWHGDMVAYAAAKGRIFAPDTVRVVNREDVETMRLAGTGPRRTFGSNAPVVEGDYGLVQCDDSQLWLAAKLPQGGETCFTPESALLIAGRHNAMNALAALALVESAGLPLESALEALATYRGEPHRVAPVLTHQGVTFIDDSKGTNVGAVVAALKGFAAQSRRILILLGGDGKGQDFSPLVDALRNTTGAIALIGRDADKIGAVLAPLGIPMCRCATLEEAVDWLWTHHQTGDVLLLSPACASWDMFRDYAERSERFVACAHRIAAEGSLCSDA